jgi:hypothetical protein
MLVDRKPIFDAVKELRGGKGFTLAEVQRLDAGIDQAIGLGSGVKGLPAAAPVSQIGLCPEDFTSAASRLACSVAQIRAVDEVESGGGWFTDVRFAVLNLDGPGGFIDGPNLPKILFEAHHFDRLTGGKYRKSHPNLSSAKWNRALYVGGQGEWERLYRAMQLDRSAALQSASWGRYQIMGFNHKLAGYGTVEAFVEAMMRSERDHLEAFVTYVINAGLADELRRISTVHADCIPFARGYNGSGYAANSYHVKLARAFKKWSAA